MDNNLTKWFEAAKQQNPVLKAGEIVRIISNPPVTKGRFFTLKKGIIMATVLCVIVSLLFWLNGFNHLPEELATPAFSSRKKPATSQSSTCIEPSTPIEKGFFEAAGNVVLSDSFPVKQKDTIKVLQQVTESFSNSPISNLNMEIYHDGELILTNIELLKLGIHTDGNVLEYENINGWIPSANVEFANKVNSVFHLQVQEQGSMRVSKGGADLDGKVKETSQSFWPAAIQIISEKDTSLTIVDMLYSLDWNSTFFNEVRPLLIPISVTTLAKPGKYSHDLQLIFWFKPEQSFFDALPSAMIYSVKRENYMELLAEYNTVYKKYAAKEQGKVPLKGFDSLTITELKKNYLNLSRDELRMLNIRKDATKITYENRFMANGRVNEILLEKKGLSSNIRINDRWNKGRRIKKRDKPFWPIAVTNPDLTMCNFLYVYPDTLNNTGRHDLNVERFKQEAGSLIPISVDGFTVFWFPKSAELLKVLNEMESVKTKLD